MMSNLKPRCKLTRHVLFRCMDGFCFGGLELHVASEMLVDKAMPVRATDHVFISRFYCIVVIGTKGISLGD